MMGERGQVSRVLRSMLERASVRFSPFPRSSRSILTWSSSSSSSSSSSTSTLSLSSASASTLHTFLYADPMLEQCDVDRPQSTIDGEHGNGPCSRTSRLRLPCAVCLRRLRRSHTLTLTACNHLLCVHCALKLQPRHLKCPLCRADVQSVTVRMGDSLANKDIDNERENGELVSLSLEMLIREKHAADQTVYSHIPQIVVAGPPNVGRHALIASFKQLYPMEQSEHHRDASSCATRVSAASTQGCVRGAIRPLALFRSLHNRKLRNASNSSVRMSLHLGQRPRGDAEAIDGFGELLPSQRLMANQRATRSNAPSSEQAETSHRSVLVSQCCSAKPKDSDGHMNEAVGSTLESENICRQFLDRLCLQSPFAPNACIGGVPVRFSAAQFPNIKSNSNCPASAAELTRSVLSDLEAKSPDFLIFTCSMQSRQSFFQMLDWDRRVRSASRMKPLPPRFWVLVVPEGVMHSLSPSTLDPRFDVGNALDALEFDQRPKTTAIVRPGQPLRARRIRNIADRALYHANIHRSVTVSAT